MTSVCWDSWQSLAADLKNGTIKDAENSSRALAMAFSALQAQVQPLLFLVSAFGSRTTLMQSLLSLTLHFVRLVEFMSTSWGSLLS